MGRLLNEDDVYALFVPNGTARLHVADIDVLPRVDAKEVVHGRWISYLDGEHIMPDVYFKCNRCGSRGHRLRWHYCPNCGAKMDLED